MWYWLGKIIAPAVVMSLLAVAAGCTESTAREDHVPDSNRSDDHGLNTTKNEALSAVQSSAPASAHQVIIDNFTFSPPTLTVPVGTKVTWINHDDVPHTATSTAKPRSFASGTLDTDQQFSFVFAKPGTYDYFCAVHPKMVGQIVVK